MFRPVWYERCSTLTAALLVVSAPRLTLESDMHIDLVVDTNDPEYTTLVLLRFVFKEQPQFVKYRDNDGMVVEYDLYRDQYEYPVIVMKGYDWSISGHQVTQYFLLPVIDGKVKCYDSGFPAWHKIWCSYERYPTAEQIENTIIEYIEKVEFENVA
jgi:hypothetical protein